MNQVLTTMIKFDRSKIIINNNNKGKYIWQ